MVQIEQSLGKSPAREHAHHPRMNLELKEFQPTEYERFAQIRTSVFPDHPLSAQELRSFDDNLDKTKYYLQRYSCLNKDNGEIVGIGDVGHMAWMLNPRTIIGRINVKKVHKSKV